jgi:beta-lactamase class A
MARVSLDELSDVMSGLTVDGTCSVWVGPVKGPAWFTRDADAPHYSASTMKLALVMTAYRQQERGLLDLDTQVPIHNSFASEVDAPRFGLDEADDSDPEVWRRMGHQVTLRWLAYRAIVRSSNLATNLLLEAVGVVAVQELLVDLGCAASAFVRGIEDVAAREAGLHNVVTARDLAVELQSLVQRSVLDDASSGEVLSVLAAQQIDDAIPARLPPGTKVAHKSGWFEGVSHDAGVVYPPDHDPFVFVMCTTTELEAAAATDLIAQAAAASWKDLVTPS